VHALAQSLDRVLSDEKPWARIAEQARRFVESERTWARSARQYQAVYASLVRRAPGALPVRA